jgi:hypothetical protein
MPGRRAAQGVCHFRGAVPRRSRALLAGRNRRKSAERLAAADKAPGQTSAVKSSEPGPTVGPKVVSIDAFRKK